MSLASVAILLIGPLSTDARRRPRRLRPSLQGQSPHSRHGSAATTLLRRAAGPSEEMNGKPEMPPMRGVCVCVCNNDLAGPSADLTNGPLNRPIVRRNY